MTDLRKGQPCSLALVNPRALRRPGTSVLSATSRCCQQHLSYAPYHQQLYFIVDISLSYPPRIHTYLSSTHYDQIQSCPRNAATSCMCISSHILYVSCTHAATSCMCHPPCIHAHRVCYMSQDVCHAPRIHPYHPHIPTHVSTHTIIQLLCNTDMTKYEYSGKDRKNA